MPLAISACGCLPVRGESGRGRCFCKPHMDMVCERNANSSYNAEVGNIHVVRDGEWIAADGTTLGADNGVGVAAALHAADSGVPHGPLGLLFTIDEERGLTGARNLDPRFLGNARILFNLDSEDDGVLFVGCAGGCDTSTVWTRKRLPIPVGWEPVEVLIGGLQGGHSGIEINENRLNAIRALARVLQGARKRVPFMLTFIEGGNKSNAIPRESRATVVMARDDVPKFREAVEAVRATIAGQYRGLDDGLTTTTQPPTDKPTAAFGQNETQQLLDLLVRAADRRSRHEPGHFWHGRDIDEPRCRSHQRGRSRDHFVLPIIGRPRPARSAGHGCPDRSPGRGHGN